MELGDIQTENYADKNVTTSNHYVTKDTKNDTPCTESIPAPNVSLSNETLEDVTETNNNNIKTVDKDYIPKDAKEFAETFYRDARFPEGFNTWPTKEQIDWMTKRTKKCFPNVGESLHPYFLGILKNGDCGRSPLDKPDWLDMEKFCKGQKFAVDHFTGMCIHNLITLIQIFSVEDSLTPLVISGQSHTPYLSFKRYLSTICHVRNWYTENPWIEGTKAYNSIQAVRKMHLNMRQKLCKMSFGQIDEEKKISEIYCPMYNTILKDLQSNILSRTSTYSLQHVLKAKFNKVKGVNQSDMALTQFAFMGLIVLHPEEFGIHNASKEDLEALCHTWRGIGYLLGIEDEYNFCNGTLEDIKQRLKDMIECVIKPLLAEVPPIWEHMSQCFVISTYYMTPIFTFDMVLLYMARLLDIDMPNIYKTMTYSNWIMYNFYTFFIRHCTKVPFISRHFHKAINYAINRAVTYDSDKHMRIKEMSTNYSYGKII